MDDEGEFSFIGLLVWLKWGAIPYLLIGVFTVWLVTKMERRYGEQHAKEDFSLVSSRTVGMITGAVMWPFVVLVFVFAAWRATRAEAEARKSGLPTNLDTWLGRIF